MKPPLKILILISFFAFSCKSKKAQPPISENVSAKREMIVPPMVINIANLPDSLQPKTKMLNKVSKPLTVVVPAREGGFYSKKLNNGDIIKIMLKPPTKKMPGVLMDEKGKPVKDASGKPFIMGTGGISYFINYNSDDGLALDAVNCSMKDKEGNLWFGTQGGGASRYDGKSFTTFTTTQKLVSSTVSCLFQDKAGNIWFGTQNGGASKYDGKSFCSFTPAEGLASLNVRDITEDKAGNLWFSTRLGASKYDGKSFITFSTKQGLPNNVVNSIVQDKAGNIWFCTTGGVSKYDGKSFTNYTSQQGLVSNNVNCIAEDKNGFLWFGTNRGISKYDGKGFTSFTTDQGLVNNQVWTIFADDEGNLWFGTYGGLSKYAGNNSFTNYTTAQGLADNDIRSISEDRDGNLWFGTYAGGVCKFAGNSFTSFTTTQGLPGILVFYINQDKAGNYWFCTTDGASKYDGQSFTNFTIAQGLADNYVQWMIQDKSGNLWFGTQGGVSKYDGKAFTNYSTDQGLAGNSVNGIEEDKDGNFWIATSGGLSKFNGRSFTNYTKAQGLINSAANTIYKDEEGMIWVGTDGGVSRFDGKTFINFTTAQGLANDQVNNIFEDKDKNIWIGTQGGISRLSAKEKGKLKIYGNAQNGVPAIKFDNFTTEQGLADDMVYAITQDKKGNMFIGTNLGFTVIPAEMSSLPFSQVRKKIEYYNKPNGYPVKDLNSNAMYCDSLGVIWGGTGSSLVRFDYSSLHKTEAQPELTIQRIKVNGENICWYDLHSGGKLNNAEDSARAMFQESVAYGKIISQAERDSVIKRFGDIRFDSISDFSLLPQNLKLSHAHNQLTIDFNAVETSKPQQVEYQYNLRGYDNDWSPITKSTSATFGNMNEGSYTFMLKTRVSGGEWSKPITYTFKVLPPWWKTWWMYLSYLLVLSGSLYGYNRYRVASFRKENRLLEEKVFQRTREVKQQADELSTINHISQALVRQANLNDLILLVGNRLRDLFNADIVYIALLDDKREIINFPYQYGDDMPPMKLGEGLASKIILTGKPLLINKDIEGTTSALGINRKGLPAVSYLGVPIPVNDEIIGVLSIQSTQKENMFSEKDQHLLTTIAANVGIVIRKAKLYEEVRKANTEADAARKIAEEANAAKSAFLSTVSHELRTPLTSVLGFAKIIKKRMEERIFPLTDKSDPKTVKTMEQISGNLNVVISEGERLTNLINNVLDLAKIEAGKMDWNMEPVNVTEVVERAIAATSSLFDQKNLRLERKFENDLPEVSGDRDKLIQVVVNLLSNAVKFTRDGSVTASIFKKEQGIVVGITDTGIGISPEDYHKVFEQFKQIGDTLTDKPKGTGLGLPICKEIVEHLGGKIWLESELGKGSTFYFELPAI